VHALEDLPEANDRRVVRTYYAEMKLKLEEKNDYRPFSKLSGALPIVIREISAATRDR